MSQTNTSDDSNEKESTGLLHLDFAMSDEENKKEYVTEIKEYVEEIKKEITVDDSRIISKVIEINIDDKNANLCGRRCVHQSKFDDPNNLCYLFFSCDRKLNQDKKLMRTSQCISWFANGDK